MSPFGVVHIRAKQRNQSNVRFAAIVIGSLLGTAAVLVCSLTGAHYHSNSTQSSLLAVAV